MKSQPETDRGQEVGRDVEAASAPLDSRHHDLIGDNLRKLFDSVESEALPDRFTDLLKKMADEEKGR